MALGNTQASVSYIGDGATYVYGAPFPVLDPTHLRVHGFDAGKNAFSYQLGVHYYVDLNRDSAGIFVSATVRLFSQLPAGWTMAIDRIVPVVQEAIFDNQGGMSPKVVEGRLDYLTMICQQLTVAFTNVVQAPPGVSPAEFIAYVYDTFAQVFSRLAGTVSSADLEALNQSLRAQIDSLWERVYGLATTAMLDALETRLGNRDRELQTAIDLLDAGKTDRADLDALRLQLDEAVASLTSQLENKMPVAPADKAHMGKGPNWVDWSLEMGEPFAKNADGFVHLVERQVYSSSLWDTSGPVTSLRPGLKPGDEDSFWRINAAGFAVLKN